MVRRQVIEPQIRAEVIKLFGNVCWLNLPGCTHVGQEDDHIVPFHHGGKDTVANIRRACKHCNASRMDRVLSGYGATLHMVVGPPEAGKSTFVADHAADDALVLDFDRLASTIMPGVDVRHDRPDALVAATQGAWQGCYNKLARLAEPVEVWVIKSLPKSLRHPQMLDEWIALDYQIHVIDPGAETVFERLESCYRPDGAKLVARQWYALHLSQRLIDARQSSRREQLAALGLRSSPSPGFKRPEW
jgi:predicted kinase